MAYPMIQCKDQGHNSSNSGEIHGPTHSGEYNEGGQDLDLVEIITVGEKDNGSNLETLPHVIPVDERLENGSENQILSNTSKIGLINGAHRDFHVMSPFHSMDSCVTIPKNSEMKFKEGLSPLLGLGPHDLTTSHDINLDDADNVLVGPVGVYEMPMTSDNCSSQDDVPENLVETNSHDDVPENLVETNSQDDVPENLVETNSQDDVPENLVETNSHDDVPENLVETNSQDDVPENLVESNKGQDVKEPQESSKLLIDEDHFEQECPICTELYDANSHKQSLLNCNHVFCDKCIKTMVSKASEANLGRVTCPLCRQTTPMMEWEIRKMQEQMLDSGGILIQQDYVTPEPIVRRPGLCGALEYRFQKRFRSGHLLSFPPCVRHPQRLVDQLNRLQHRCRCLYLCALVFLLFAEFFCFFFLFLPIVIFILLIIFGK